METIQSTERGQVLVLLVLGVVALLGFTALAIDGGMVYSDRRHAQAAADAASLTGGGAASESIESIFLLPAANAVIENWDCSSSYLVNAQIAARNAAVAQAMDNGYTIDQDISDLNGVSTACGVVDYGGWSQKYIDVIVNVTRDTPTSFAHFVFGGPLSNSVEAVARLEPSHDLANGNAIFALREDCPNPVTGGVHFLGTGNTTVDGGGIFSNACMRGVGDAEVTVTGGGIACVGETDETFCYTDHGADIDPYPNDLLQDFRIEREDFGIDPAIIMDPLCDSLPSYGNWSGDGVISQGRYSRIRVNKPSDFLFMQPGLYCVSNEILINGGGVIGHGVTIYMTGGKFSTAGNITVKLSAPPQANADPNYINENFGEDEEPAGTGFADWMVNALGKDEDAQPSDLELEELYPASTLKFPPDYTGVLVGGSKAVRGLLIYSRDGNTDTIHLHGNSYSYYIGTVYAPDGTIFAGGTSELEVIGGQMIADTVVIDGTTDLSVTYNDDVTMVAPTELELHE